MEIRETLAHLAPAIVLTSVSAFEGFVEEFVALVAAHRNQRFGQIAKVVSMNNPTVSVFDEKLRQVLSWGGRRQLEIQIHGGCVEAARDRRLFVDRQADVALGRSYDARAGVDAGPSLSHPRTRTRLPTRGMAGPLKGTVAASSVLRSRKEGKHSLSLRGA